MDYFGEFSSKNMPRHLFWECVYLDHESAVRADITRQNFTVCPRYWYVDATFCCSQCEATFCFTAAQQKLWYEELGFYVDSYSKDCLECRKNKRRKKELRQEYDRDIKTALESNDIDLKVRLSGVIDDMCSFESELPKRIHQNRHSLAKQITECRRPADKNTVRAKPDSHL